MVYQRAKDSRFTNSLDMIWIYDWYYAIFFHGIDDEIPLDNIRSSVIIANLRHIIFMWRRR